MAAQSYMSCLKERYPAAFKDGGRMIAFDCGVGWFEIVETLCALIADRNLRQAETKTSLLGAEEKFGMLRISISDRTPEAYEWIRFAELHSTRVCEICGGKGKLVYREGWQRTRCEMHSTTVRLTEDS